MTIIQNQNNEIFASIYGCKRKNNKLAYLEEIDAEQEEFFNEQLRTIIENKIQSLDDFKTYLSVDKEKNKEKILEKLSEMLDQQ